MNKLNLSHEHTPANLNEINSQLESVLNTDPVDDEKLRALIDSRDKIILEHLNGLQPEHEKTFAEKELGVNKVLSKLIEKQLQTSLKQLSGLVRGKKSVNKYK